MRRLQKTQLSFISIFLAHSSRMDTYEVHIPCGQKVVVVCKEAGEDVKILKNGKSVYGEESKSVASVEDENNSSSEVEDEMATKGGKRSRRNGASRKNNMTRRKNQAGGKRGPNSYMKFASKMRPQILKEHPELKSDVVAVARKIGEKWRALSDAEKKKF